MSKLSDAAYCSEWYNLNKSERKMFLFFLTQTQVRPHVGAYGFIELSVESFGNVHNLQIYHYVFLFYLICFYFSF